MILCVDSLADILVHQSGTFFVLLYFDCSIDCIVFLSVCLSVSTHCCVNKDYQNYALNLTERQNQSYFLSDNTLESEK